MRTERGLRLRLCLQTNPFRRIVDFGTKMKNLKTQSFSISHLRRQFSRDRPISPESLTPCSVWHASARSGTVKRKQNCSGPILSSGHPWLSTSISYDTLDFILRRTPPMRTYPATHLYRRIPNLFAPEIRPHPTPIFNPSAFCVHGHPLIHRSTVPSRAPTRPCAHFVGWAIAQKLHPKPKLALS